MPMTEMKFVDVPLDLRALAGLKKAELVERIAEASAEHRAAKGESPWLPAEVFGV